MMDSKSTLTSDKALLIGFYSEKVDPNLGQQHLQELAELVKTFGVLNQEKLLIPLRIPDSATYMGSGKVEEIALKVHAEGFTLVVVDDEISATQQRNLEKAFKKPVMERTEIILGVFSQRAQTKEAKLQVELAKAKYQMPRLKRLWTHLSRQAGGGLHVKGAGETQLEIDKRLLAKQIIKLEQELKEVKKHREVQRSLRLKQKVPSFALVGYTNAGKSTLFNALCDANAFVEDKLFATLDTTARILILPNHQKVILIDTVGFIRKIPHTLVAAFKSTLEESIQTDVLIHVLDVSHPNVLEHAKATLEVLKELKADKKNTITVFNKIDQITSKSHLAALKVQFPKTVAVSALKKEGLETLFNFMMEALSSLRKEVHLLIPQKEYHLVSLILREGTLLEQDYQGDDIAITASIPLTIESQLAPFVKEEAPS